MNSSPRNDALRRKIGGQGPDGKVGTMSPAKALRLALSGASETTLRVPLRISGIDEARLGPGKLAEALPSNVLLLVLEAKAGLRGVAALDSDALAAVVEAATTGRVTGASAADRSPTATDALLVRRYLDTACALLVHHLGDDRPPGWRPAWQTGEMVAEVRHLPHLLEDMPYRLVTLDLSFSGGAAEGKVWLVLPWETANAPVSFAPSAGAPPGSDDAWRENMETAVLGSEVALDAVLYRCRLPISYLTSMQVGDLLTVPSSAIGEVALKAHDGRTVGWARLGRSGPSRAVRLATVESQPDPVESEDVEDQPRAVNPPDQDASNSGVV